jgi:argininosuccinate lyase
MPEEPRRGQGEGARLREPPAPELVRASFQLEIADAPVLHRGLGLADLAHVLMLIEIGVVPADDGAKLLGLLLELLAVPVEEFPLDPNLEDVYSNREAWVRKRDEAVAGWLGAGRPRREPATIAYRMAVRDRLLELADAAAAAAQALLEQAEAHVETIAPDYTYLQPATPTSLGHYLTAFVYPLLRDLDRLRESFARTNFCPGGIGNINGSRLPLDRERLASLLGFAAPITHTRDAMWQVDQPFEVMADVVSLLLHLDRLAEDLQIWNTAEFGFVTLADRHARISMIMPQKKNPYSLAFIRGMTGNLLGRVVSMAAVAKSPSAQMDNRIFALGEVPRSLDMAIDATRLVAGVVGGLSFDEALLRRRAGEGFICAMDLAETLMQQGGLAYRQAHRVVALAVRLTLDVDARAERIEAETLDRAAREVTGRPLAIAAEALAQVADPGDVVRTRRSTGGAAPDAVRAMIAGCRTELGRHREWYAATRAALREAEDSLVRAARARAGEGRARGAAAPRTDAEKMR